MQGLRLGTRGSPLALAQARKVASAIESAQRWPDGYVEIVPVTTTGDQVQDRPLSELGGKALWTKELDKALIAGELHFCVHSMKDVESVRPKGIHIAAIRPRGDVRDRLIGAESIDQLKQGATVGTSSARRKAQLLALRPDLNIVPIRGNVETRLAKLARGEADGIILARAGLSRLGIRPDGAEILNDWLPALCQGAIGIEIRESNHEAAELIAAIDHGDTHVAIACERGFLATLDGSCRTPIAGHARLDGQTLAFHGEVLTTDGRSAWAVSRTITLTASKDAREAAEAAGRDAAREILERAGDKLPRF